jgi:hypothetical protein
VGNFLNSMDSSLAQIARARALNPLGVALYSYAVPALGLDASTATDRDSFAARLRELFPRPAPTPALAGLVSGGLGIEIPGHEGVSMTVDDGLGTLRTWVTDGTGLAGGVDLGPGRYTVTVSAPDVDPTPFQVQVVAGSASLVRLAPGTPAS